MSPEVKSKVYSTTEAQMSSETVVIVEFELACKNNPRVRCTFIFFTGVVRSTVPSTRIYCPYSVVQSCRQPQPTGGALANRGGAPLPSPSPSSPPFPPLPSLRSRPPQIQLGGLGERCKLPQRGLGLSRSRNRIWCIFALKDDIWWQRF